MSVRRKKITNSEGVLIETEWWIADYADGSGKRHQRHFKTKGEATAHEERNKVAIREGNYVSVDRSITVADAAKVWLKRVEANGMRHRGPVERTTRNQYGQHVNLHIVPRIGKLKLAKMSSKDIESFRDTLLAKGGDGKPVMSRALARKVMVSLKSLLKANQCGHLADDVVIGVDARTKHKLEIGKDIPTTAEIKRLIDATKDNPKLHALLLMAALCGPRASELRGLRWSDIDFRAAEMHIRQRADRYNEIGAPKSKEGRRTIPIDPRLVLALKAWKLNRGEQEFVFPTSTGAIEHHANMLRSLRPAMRAAGLVAKNGKPKYALHAFRHFFASWCINPLDRGGRQLTPKVVQTLMGHSSIAITLDIYGHLFPSGSDRSELAASVQALLG
jgi:integrase